MIGAPVGGPFHAANGSFVGSGGIERYSKKSDYQSGRPDLNRRPLDPQSRSGRRWTWLSVAQWAPDQPRQSPGVAGCRLKSACVGSWFGSFARGGRSTAGRTAKTVNNARRAASFWSTQPMIGSLPDRAQITAICVPSLASAQPPPARNRLGMFLRWEAGLAPRTGTAVLALRAGSPSLFAAVGCHGRLRGGLRRPGRRH